MENPLDFQEGGSHYKSFAIQPVEFIHANGLDFFQGNVVKYVCRHNRKGEGVQDLLKAKHYIDLILKLDYGITDQPTEI